MKLIPDISVLNISSLFWIDFLQRLGEDGDSRVANESLQISARFAFHALIILWSIYPGVLRSVKCHRSPSVSKHREVCIGKRTSFPYAQLVVWRIL